MAKARILGNQATIQIVNADGGVITVGEVDKFSAKSISDVMKSHPLGEGEITSQVVFKGWDLEFEGGIVDYQLIEEVLQLQDEQIALKLRSPYFTVNQKITYFDGNVAQYQYTNVSLSELNFDASSAEEQVKQSFKGFSGSRRKKILQNSNDATAALATDANNTMIALLNATATSENRDTQKLSYFNNTN